MKCKCGHRFCWKCLKPWRPFHTDFYNCTGKVATLLLVFMESLSSLSLISFLTFQTSQAASDHKKFTDYNERCTVHEKSRAFAERLSNLIKGIHETIPIKTLTFFNDACDLLVRCYRVSPRVGDDNRFIMFVAVCCQNMQYVLSNCCT